MSSLSKDMKKGEGFLNFFKKRVGYFENGLLYIKIAMKKFQ